MKRVKPSAPNNGAGGDWVGFGFKRTSVGEFNFVALWTSASLFAALYVVAL